MFKFIYVMLIVITPYGSFKGGVRQQTSQVLQLEISEDRIDCDIQRPIIEAYLSKGPNIVETVCVRTLKTQDIGLRKTSL